MSASGQVVDLLMEEDRKVVVKVEVKVGRVEANVGLNQHSAYKAILKRKDQLWPTRKPSLPEPAQPSTPLPHQLRDNLFL